MADRIILYTITGCAHCETLRERLDNRGAAYDEINVGDHPERIPELLKLTGRRRIVPVVVDGAHVLVAPEGGSEF